MQKQFVTYEIALKLKELVFDEECLARFEEDNYLHIVTSNNIGRRKFIQVPLWQQVFDWFREKHNIVILITPYTADYWTFKIYTLSGIVRVLYLNGKNVTIKSGNHKVFKTYLGAKEEATLKAIEILTEQNQDK